MHIWTDNSTIHAYNRCVNRAADDENDVLSFLQLSCILIFASRVSIYSREGDAVKLETAAYLKDVGKHLGNSILLETHDFADDQFTNACTNASEVVRHDIVASFEHFAQVCETISPKSTLNDSIIAKSGRPLHMLIAGGCPDDIRQQLRESAFKDSSVLPEYMIAINDDLAGVLRRFVLKFGWSEKATSAFDIYSRFRLNTMLSRLGTSKLQTSSYLPHATRGRQFQNQHLAATLALERILDEASRHILSYSDDDRLPDLPLLFDALIFLGHGEPEGIACEVARLRELASDVRKELRYVSSNPHQFSGALAEFRGTLKSIYDGSADEVRIRSIYGCLLTMAKGRGPALDYLTRVIESDKREKRAVVFSELLAGLPHKHSDPKRYLRFVKTCMERKHIGENS